MIGYVAITDGAKCRFHSIKCPNVDFNYFRTKVIKNNRKNGKYFWSSNIKGLIDRWKDSEDCLHCKHLY